MTTYEAAPSDDGAIVRESDTQKTVVTLLGDDVYPMRDGTPLANAIFCAVALNGRLATFFEPDKDCTPGPWRLSENDGGGFDIVGASPEGTETIGYIDDKSLGQRIVDLMFRVPDYYWDSAGDAPNL